MNLDVSWFLSLEILDLMRDPAGRKLPFHYWTTAAVLSHTQTASRTYCAGCWFLGAAPAAGAGEDLRHQAFLPAAGHAHPISPVSYDIATSISYIPYSSICMRSARELTTLLVFYALPYISIRARYQVSRRIPSKQVRIIRDHSTFSTCRHLMVAGVRSLVESGLCVRHTRQSAVEPRLTGVWIHRYSP